MRKDRLEELADFLDELEPEEFDFSRVVSKVDATRTCGTTCCALGWLPRVFPLSFSWIPGWIPRLSDDTRAQICMRASMTSLSIMAVLEFFEISRAEYGLLFMPRPSGFVPESEKNYLPQTATAQEVAARIREFVRNDGVLSFDRDE